MHYTICLQLIYSSGQIALPPAFAWLEQRGASTAHTSKYLKFLCLSPEKHVITNSKLFCDYMSRITLPLCHLCVCMVTFYNNDEERQKFAFSSDWSLNLPFRILISSQMGFNWIFINFSRSSKETFQQDSKFKWFLLWSPPSVPYFFAL